MSNAHEFETRKTELDNPGSLYVNPESLKHLERNVRGGPLTFGATPLNPHRPDVRLQQVGVKKDLQIFFPQKSKDVPFDINIETAHFIESNYYARLYHRIQRNFDSFQYRGVFDISQVSEELDDIIERSITGHASPAELLLVADVLQIPTIELASVTHPYGQRFEHLAIMRSAVQDAILMHGGTLLNTPHTYEVRRASYVGDTLDNENVMPTLLITRTIELGTLKNTICVERSSFALLLDRIPASIADKIRAIKYDPNWFKKVMDVSGFQEVVARYLSDDRHDIAVPISTTAFAMDYNHIENLLNDEEHIMLRQREIAVDALKQAGNYSKLSVADDEG